MEARSPNAMRFPSGDQIGRVGNQALTIPPADGGPLNRYNSWSRVPSGDVSLSDCAQDAVRSSTMYTIHSPEGLHDGSRPLASDRLAPVAVSITAISSFDIPCPRSTTIRDPSGAQLGASSRPGIVPGGKGRACDPSASAM